MFDDSEKVYIYIVIGIVVAVLIGVIVIIWTPDKKSEIETSLNSVDTDADYITTQQEKYENLLKRLLLTSNFDELYEYIDDEWLEENNFNDSDSVKNYLVSNFIIGSSSISFSNEETLATDEEYVFKYTLDNSKAMSVFIYEYSPYDYEISFEQEEISSLSGKTYTYTCEYVDYTVTVNYVGSNIIQYQLKIENNGSDSYTWYSDNANSITLNLSDGTGMICSDVTSFASNILTINSGGYITVNLLFNVSMENMSLIDGITLSNLYKNDVAYSVKIPLKGGE